MESFNKKSGRVLGGRQFVNIENPEQKQATERIKLEAQSVATERRDSETCGALRSLINGVDFGTLYDIYGEYFEKSGVPRERMDTDVAFFFREFPNEEAIMEYDHTAHAICLNVPFFRRIFENQQEQVETVLPRFVHLIAHEYGHAFGYIEKRRDDAREGDSHVVHDMTTTAFDRFAAKQRFEFETGEWVPVTSAQINMLFNEGVTELLAQEVTEEYVRRVPEMHIEGLDVPVQLSAKWLARANIGDEKRTYSAAERLVVAMTDVIAEYAGVPQESVWRAIVRQYFSGEHKLSEIGDVFDEVLGPDFGRSLADAKQRRDIDDLVRNFKTLAVKHPEAIEKWLAHLGVTRGAH